MRAYTKKQGRIASIVSAMMIAVLFIGLTPTALAADTLLFSDVPSNHTYYDDIRWAAENGIVTGYNGKFDPDGKVTLLQFYTMLSRSIPEDENDTGSLGAEKGTMIYHLRRAVRRGWTGDYRADIELQKDKGIAVGMAWNRSLSANGTQVYANQLYGGTRNPFKDGIRAAKEIGFITENDTDEMRSVTRAEAVSIIHAARTNTKAMSEPPIVAVMKGTVKNLPQSVFNDFYADMAEIPEPIRKAFIADGWKISFDTDKINAYSEKSGIYSINGMTVYSEKTIYLATERSLLHEMGHYYQEKLKSSGMDADVYSTFDTFRSEEKWSGTLYTNSRQTDGAEFFADAFRYYVEHGTVRADPTGADKENPLGSQMYFDHLAAQGWIY